MNGLAQVIYLKPQSVLALSLSKVSIFVVLPVYGPPQVETFGSMEKEEKVRFILEQMRLGLARNDYIRTQIISKKISIKFFASASDSDVVQVG